MRIALTLCGAVLAAVASWSTAQATTLDGHLTVDNEFNAYISTDDSALGTLVATGNNWPDTINFTHALTAGVTNYLHVVGLNDGGPDMFVGSFGLSDSLFHFANGTQNLATDLTHWASSAGAGTLASPTWSTPGSTPISFGANGDVGTIWGTRPGIDLAALFIWQSPDSSLAFFSTAITPVVAATPIPGALPLFAAALGGLGLLARRKHRTSAV